MSAPAQALNSAVEQLGAAAQQLAAAMARLEAVVAQLVAAAQTLSEPAPKPAPRNARALTRHACCKRAGVRPASYYTSRRAIPARRPTRWWTPPHA